MRDRTKLSLQSLQEQVQYLSGVAAERDEQNITLQKRLHSLELEVDELKAENGALRLKLMGHHIAKDSTAPANLETWQMPPLNTPPACMADQIIQDFVTSRRSSESSSPDVSQLHATSGRFNLCYLLDQQQRPDDALSNIVGDLVLSYHEIDTLPKQVSVFWNIATLLKWQLRLDESSWAEMPAFLRPTEQQLKTPHAAWIDRIPWPRVRDYLIEHSDITLDDWALAYSTNFEVQWPYLAQHVVLSAGLTERGKPSIVINPVFQEHVQDVRTWIVMDGFRTKFPEMATLIDEDTKPG